MPIAAVNFPARAANAVWINAGLLVTAVLITAFVYWPGLSGAYIYDDYSFLVQNTDLQIATPTLGDWWRAAQSFPAAHQGRWLTMLSFAVNYYLTGLDPFWIKLTNLGIHLGNGVLLYLAVSRLLDWWAHRAASSLSVQQRGYVALALAACWLLLPVNLTAVLYSVQRLESLSNAFVLLGLWLYFRARLRLETENRGIGGMALALVLCTGVGLLAKESAILLPLYAACAEFALGSLDRGHPHRKRITQLYAALLMVPLLVGLAWLVSWVGGASTYERSFSMSERLLTEARVVVNYIGWCLLPTPRALSLYHDDFTLSTGWFDPPSTLAAIAALGLLLGAGFWQRSRRPLFCLGILWFFAGHVLTATVIPLDLIYEHRNYFPAVGLLLACASLLVLEPATRSMTPKVATMIALAALVFYGFNTNLRAREWSHPLRLALSEVDKHPRSPFAQYELARTLMTAIGDNADSPMIPRAREALTQCMHLPHSSITCEQGLVIMAAGLKLAEDPSWWTSMAAKLDARVATQSDISALQSLLECQKTGVCPPARELGAVIVAGMKHPNPNARLIGTYADYSDWALHDDALTERLLRSLIEVKPAEPEVRAHFARFLISRGRLDDAEQQIAALERLNTLDSLSELIGPLRVTLAQARNANPLMQ